MLRPKAARILFPDAGAVAILEAAKRWHGRRAAMESAIAQVSPELSARRTWPPGLPEWTWSSPDGRPIDLVPLANQRDLAGEGTVGPDVGGVAGLDHCVGGFNYVLSCLRGTCRIVSVRERLPEGRWRRLSTVEFQIDREAGGWGIVRRQHRGLRNAEPEADARTAVSDYERFLAGFGADGRPLPGGERFRPPDDAFAPVLTELAVSTMCGFEWNDDAAMEKVLRIWEPMLRRPLRGHSCDGFGVAAGIAPDHAAHDGYVEKPSSPLDIFDAPSPADEGDHGDAFVPEADETPRGVITRLAGLVRRLRG
jgi:hypothetical protein